MWHPNIVRTLLNAISILLAIIYVSKAFVQYCKGDYLNPTNEPCADVVQTIDNVSFNFHLSSPIIFCFTIFSHLNIVFFISVAHVRSLCNEHIATNMSYSFTETERYSGRFVVSS